MTAGALSFEDRDGGMTITLACSTYRCVGGLGAKIREVRFQRPDRNSGPSTLQRNVKRKRRDLVSQALPATGKGSRY